MNLGEKQLTRAWLALFPDVLPRKMPSSYSHQETIKKNLGASIPSAGNIVGDNVPVGHATGQVSGITVSELQNVSLPGGNNDVLVKNGETNVRLHFNKIKVSGDWAIYQDVNRWTTKGWGPFKVPWRENGEQVFKGNFSTDLSPDMGIDLKIDEGEGLDDSPTSEVTRLSMSSVKVNVKFAGANAESALIAAGANLFSALNTSINDAISSVLKDRVENNQSVKNLIADNLNDGLKKYWAQDI